MSALLSVRVRPNRLIVLGLFPATLALAAAALLADPHGLQKATNRAKKPAPVAPKIAPVAAKDMVNVGGLWQKSYDLTAGKSVEIAVRLTKPSALPANGRLAVSWTLDGAKPFAPSPADGRKPDAEEISTLPTPNWRKVLHALDNSVYLIYRAPVAGRYTLRIQPVTDEPASGSTPRWREKGNVPMLATLPSQTPWPAGTVAPVQVSVAPIALGDAAEQEKQRTIIEYEPNDTPEQAVSLPISPGKPDEIKTYEITGTADDVEYFDNGKVGKSGEDWYRIDYKGTEPRLLTAQISMPGQTLAARVRAYHLDLSGPKAAQAKGGLNVPLLPVSEYFGKVLPKRKMFTEGKEVDIHEGRDPNERTHQQDEQHRANISRMVYPGETYFLRVEANAPGYQLQVRVLKAAPYDNPQLALRQAMYNHIGQVDAWLTNRPRGASLERRIRDTGNLLGTGCVSCHTQSGIWGPSGPIKQGYAVENVQNLWHMENLVYECLRPCNDLKDASNNTSLAPLDIGDGPAGTRAAGFNIVQMERLYKPKQLHRRQQVRTANFVLQTSDPGGINAAGPGSNIGFVVVNMFATEILKTAWEKTGDPKYFRAMQAKAKQVYDVNPAFTDDLGLRMDYFNRVFPIGKYVEWSAKCAAQEANLPPNPLPKGKGSISAGTSLPKGNKPVGEGKVSANGESKPAGTDGAKPAGEAGKPVNGKNPFDVNADKFVADVRVKLKEDEVRLRAIQNQDGTWGFSPGTTPDGGKTWKKADSSFDPSPTALGIWGLTAAGYGKTDPAVAKAAKALFAMQDAVGRWNKSAITGFVTTSYVMHALSRLYPETPVKLTREMFAPKPNESLPATIKRVRSLALATKPEWNDLLRDAAKSPHTLVRYWASIGLGANPSKPNVAPLIGQMGGAARPVRDAAAWAMRQTLLDDKGWEALLTAAEKGDDTTREQAMLALNMRADATSTKAKVAFARLTNVLDKGMNRDANPAVRAWATKAAWQWWIWNPPVRPALNTAWVRLLERPEPSALVENCLRYSSQALFIANGHKANGSGEHQYKELATLFEMLTKRLDDGKDLETKRRLARRIVGVGGTFFETSGGDGGPGQMGYVTPGSGEMMGKATLLYLAEATKGGDLTAIRAGVEGGSNVPYGDLNKFLVDYSLKGPEEVRQLAAAAVSDPRSVSLPAVPEQVEPQMAQVKRGAMEPPRRPQISDPILALWSRVNWVIPKTEEQQRNFFTILIPRFDQYVSPEDVAKIEDPARKAEVERQMNAAWYLANGLGDVLEKNPDLHHEIVFRQFFPASFRNPLEEQFWIRSVDWLLTFGNEMRKVGNLPNKVGEGVQFASGLPLRTRNRADERPAPHFPAQVLSFVSVAFRQSSSRTKPSLRGLFGESKVVLAGFGQEKKADVQKPDVALSIKDRALQLYLDCLKPTARPETRAIAIRMANKTSLRTNPEVLRALKDVLTFEKDPALRQIMENVLKQGDEKFIPDLLAALKEEKHPSIAFDAKGEPQVTKAQQEDIVYFRDYVMPEMSRQKRNDQQSCVGCHGLPGRVPSFYIKAPDTFGYLPVKDLVFNYRVVQGKVKLNDLEKSKFLRKPLNIQDGQEDGHQGGRRYSPKDEGYLILRRWVENQPKLNPPLADKVAAVPKTP